MFIRHAWSPATRYSAPVEVTLRALSVAMAIDTSGFLIENVPPNPQHCSAPGRSSSSIPPTARNSRSGRSPTFATRIEWQVGW